MKTNTTILLFFLTSLSVFSQNGKTGKMLKDLLDHKFDKVEKAVLKAYKKDSISPEVLYSVSRVLAYDSFPGYDPDSAYQFILEALIRYPDLEEKEKKSLKKEEIDSQLFMDHKVFLDSLAFERVRKKNTVEAYDWFLNIHLTAVEVEEAIDLRYTAAYKVARREDTYLSYKYFMDTYPQAPQFKDATQRYERHFYETQTGDGKLKSIDDFLRINPATPYRKPLERQILEISTAGNQLQDYINFMRKYPETTHRETVAGLVFHLLKEDKRLDEFPKEWYSDSLLRSMGHSSGTFVPVVKNREYLFISSDGKVLSEKTWPGVYQKYLCMGATGDFLFVKDEINQLIGLSGKVFYKGEFDMVEDLGHGMLKALRDGNWGGIHKTGQMVLPYEYDEIRVVLGAYLAHEQNGKWGLSTFLGRKVLDAKYDNIEAINGLILIEKDERYAITTPINLKPGADGEVVILSFQYDDYEPLTGQSVWVSSNDREGLLNNRGTYDIPLSKHKILPDNEGYLIESEDGYTFFDMEFLEVFYGYTNMEQNKTFFLGDHEGQLFLVNKKTEQKTACQSAKLLGDYFALAETGEGRVTIFSDSAVIATGDDVVVQLVRSPQGPEYIMHSDGDKKTVYGIDGSEIMSGKFSSVSALGHEYLVYEQKGKKGLYSTKGERLLRPYNDAIGSYERGGVTVLRRGKFGYYHMEDSLYINPVFDSKIMKGGKGLMIAEKDDQYVLLRSEEEQVGRAFDDIILWTDSLYIVETESGLYSFYNPFTDKEVLKGLEEVRVLKEGDGKLALITKGADMGLAHKDHGIIIPPEFSSVDTMMGDIYKAEKYISAAKFYVVVYFNSKGKVIWKQGLDVDEYDLIYCDM